jgi:hypothetical protein
MRAGGYRVGPPTRVSRAGPPAILPVRRGAIAQLGERLNGIQKVRGSNPRSSTKMTETMRRTTALALAIG